MVLLLCLKVGLRDEALVPCALVEQFEGLHCTVETMSTVSSRGGDAHGPHAPGRALPVWRRRRNAGGRNLMGAKKDAHLVVCSARSRGVLCPSGWGLVLQQDSCCALS